MTDARLLELAVADAPTRRRALEDLAESPAASHDLRRYREALRERYPVCEDVKDATRGLHVDGLLRVAPNAYYVFGWAFDNERDTRSLCAVSPEGERVELFGGVFRHPHADADGFYSSTFRPRASGFVAFFETKRGDAADDNWLVISRNADGVALEARAPAVESQPQAARETILSHLRHDRDAALIEHHTFPAVSRIQADLMASATVDLEFAVGEPVTSPVASFIIPVFGRLDLIEHQLVAFARDEQMREVELIYVLDSPELADEFRAKLEQLSVLYRLALRGAVHQRNSGFAAACARGVSRARAERVVILHSDVVPAAPGWITEMANAGEGPVGATLLYHDDSIQHAGYRTDDGGRVRAVHKGLHRELAASTATQKVDAVSDACIMLNKRQFLDAGGFAGNYVSAHEDVDLCARLVARGLTPTIAPNVFLYHLEGQSRPKRLRELAAPYDAWLVARRLREHSQASGGER